MELIQAPYFGSEDSEPIPVTNVLTGLQQPTISGDDRLLIFAGYSGIGWDLYSMANPLTLKKQTVNPTQFILNGKTEDESIADLRKHKSNMRSMMRSPTITLIMFLQRDMSTLILRALRALLLRSLFQ